MHGRWGFVLACLAAGGTAVAQQPAEIRFADAERPPVLEAIELAGPVRAIAFSADGRRAAVAAPRAERERDSVLRLYGTGREVREVEVAGVLRSLLFDLQGNSLFALVHKPAKHRPGETQLALVDWETAKLRRLRRVPSTAAALEHWLAGASLLIAARNEIRTVRLEGWRSGPLFRVPGNNRAVTALASSDLILVGQDSGLLLINLADPPGPEEMPVRERVATPGAVRMLATSARGAAALARLEDGRLLSVAFDPLRWDFAGSAAAVATLQRGRSRAPIALAPLPVEEPSGVVTEPAVAPPVDEPAPAPAAEAPAAAPPVDEPVEAPSTDAPAPSGPVGGAQAAPVSPPEEEPAPPPVAPSPPSPARPAPPVQVDSREKVGSPATRGGPQVRGRLAGPAVAQVAAIVLYGPSSILREAARVVPQADGSWQAHGLQPGRYRIQVDGGGGRVLVSDPPFVVLEVTDGATLDSPEIRVLRSYSP